MMSLYSFFSAIELGLIYSLMVLGLFISYRILNIPDLTVDGSFTLGAAVAVVATLAGHPVLGLLLAALAGAAAGFVTALLQTRMKIQPILAGIITMTALYSINLMVMDNKANLPLAQGESIYHNLPGMLLSGLAAIGVAAVLVLFLQTPAGLAVRATGDNEAMVRSSSINADRIDHLYQDPHIEGRKFIIHYGDLTDSMNLTRIIEEAQPDEIYNLAAMSHVKVSFDTPEYTANADAVGTLRILEAVRLLGLTEKSRIYQASTSELYGLVQETPQRESTPFYPRSPYAVAKLYAYWITVNYREAYGMHASNGILFNHESPLRGETFVTRKITRAVSRIAMGMQDMLYLGNLSAKRDWGHAKDYVRAMHAILQQDTPSDYVIATGVTTTVRDFARMAFAEAGMEITFSGEGIGETGKITDIDETRFNKAVGKEYFSHASHLKGKEVIKIDAAYFRPTEVEALIGDATKAREVLGWKPEYDLKGLVREMMENDIKLTKKEEYLKQGGYVTLNYYE